MRALVLGGGGVTGVAWELGVLEGLRRSGVDLTAADLVIGTSAGSVVGTRITTGPLDAAYDDQLRPADGELAAKLGPTTLLKLGVMLARRGEQSAKWRKVGKAALAAHPEPADARLAVIRSRIGEPEWPERDLRITAVDVDRGEFTVFDRTSGVSVLDAVAASCAVPLVWPPVRIGGTTYVDGGARSATNADLAEGADTVVVLAPTTLAVSRDQSVARQLERTGASRTHVISPDAIAGKAMGTNALDPSRRRASAETGLRQGTLIAEELAPIWA
ncbi:patatin-like phospholipase family protein [Nocardioides marmoriginsengisoli]|nr:patatin-like phospholipase family protein [Nocardioides marmoriginsengisoli]